MFTQLEMFRIADIIQRGSTQDHIEWMTNNVKHEDIIQWYNLRVPCHMREDRTEYPVFPPQYSIPSMILEWLDDLRQWMVNFTSATTVIILCT